MKRISILFLLCLAACAENSRSVANSKENQKQIEEKVIYGDDNRIENYQASDALKALASSTVALVESSSLTRDAQGKFTLLGSNYGDQHHLCATEPFREQTAGAFCSGFLVAPDIMVTAGHCITSATDCADVRFVFDFAVKAPGIEKKTFSADEIYSCKEIISRQQLSAGADYAVVRLDRKVVGKNPLKLRNSGTLSVGDSLFVIGHPAGLPQKIAGGAKVRSVQSDYVTANLDTYGGNSGSAVFNGSTNEVEGILVRGDTDFTWNGSCSVSYRCADNSCRGEDVTRIDQILKYLPSSPVTPPPPDSAQVFTVSANLVIPDAPKPGIVSSVSVGVVPAGRKVQVLIDLVHSYRGDLVVELVSPSGKSVLLHNRGGGSLDNLMGTYGVDLTSVQALDSLSQETQTGKWSLKVTDKAQVDVGTLRKWALIFQKP